MITFEDLHHEIQALPVFDTHTHMDTAGEQCTKGLYAQNFFHICWYFWFLRELEATGYPYNSVRELQPEEFEEEAQRIHTALQQTQNTYWTNTVMQAMENLYGIRPDSVENILELNEVMASKQDDPEWGNSVLAKLNIRKIGTQPDTKGVCARIEDKIVDTPFMSFGGYVKQIRAAAKPAEAIEQTLSDIQSLLSEYHARGVRTIRPEWPFKPHMGEATQKDFTSTELEDDANLRQFLGHRVFEMFNEHGFNLQIFFGMCFDHIQEVSDEPLIRTYALNDPKYVCNMHNIFESYLNVTFELFCASELSSLDMVQAARIYPNVYPGGMWWFNFRRSVCDKSMQYRLEALPANRCSIVASDARCVEWTYIKVLYIKKVMAHFFHKQIEEGWISKDTAIYTARHWLHDTAAELYS
jgi:glucuronate isomerase